MVSFLILRRFLLVRIFVHYKRCCKVLFVFFFMWRGIYFEKRHASDVKHLPIQIYYLFLTNQSSLISPDYPDVLGKS